MLFDSSHIQSLERNNMHVAINKYTYIENVDYVFEHVGHIVKMMLISCLKGEIKLTCLKHLNCVLTL